MPIIEEGYFKIARKLNYSPIWQTKPSWWLKVWVYIIGRVNHADNGVFRRGTNFFSLRMIWEECFLINDGFKNYKSVDNVIRWLKSAEQITTRKTTRGFHITVCNYDIYQDGLNYENDTENDTKNDKGTTQERQRNDTINKNGNNEIKKITYAQRAYQMFLDKYRETTGMEYVASWAKDVKLLKKVVSLVTQEEFERCLENFFNDAFAKNNGYVFNIFISQINRYRSLSNE